MKKTIILILFLLCLPITIKAASLGEILANPDSFNQETVVVTGEAIGEILETDGGYWVNLLSEGHSLGVFSQVESSFSSISYWGSYAETGDYLKITGKFYKDCPLHYTSDIHFESLVVLKKGYQNEPKVSAQKVKFAKLGFIISLIVSLIYFLKEKYGTKT